MRNICYGLLVALFGFTTPALSQTDASLAEVIQVGQARQARGENLVQNISHINEHYGNLVTYMRLKGMVPPSTERAAAASGSR